MIKIDHETMMRNFAQLQNEVTSGLLTAETQLRSKQYVKATESMEVISKRMAQTAVMMRNLMIRAGMIPTGGNIS